MNLIHIGGDKAVKLIGVIFSLLLMCTSCLRRNITEDSSEKNLSSVAVEQIENAETVEEQLAKLNRLDNEPMEKVIEMTFSFEVPVRVYEKEKGYYLGYIAFKKDREIISGYDAEPPLGFFIESISYSYDRMVFFMRVVLLEKDERTGEVKQKNPGLFEVVVTKDEYLATLKDYVNGVSGSGKLEAKGTIINGPIF